MQDAVAVGVSWATLKDCLQGIIRITRHLIYMWLPLMQMTCMSSLKPPWLAADVCEHNVRPYCKVTIKCRTISCV